MDNEERERRLTELAEYHPEIMAWAQRKRLYPMIVRDLRGMVSASLIVWGAALAAYQAARAVGVLP